MNTRFKSGSLAVVIQAGDPHITPGLVDRIVEIVRPAIDGEEFISIDGVVVTCRDSRSIWVVKSRSPLPWICVQGADAGKVRLFRERAIADQYLRPISGVPVTRDVKDEVTA
ncbi:hypothetical protein [Paraburkholderia tagetis]|uniref:Uncharacterized protein n=1 Tax=Paraburkholderia tagetis TaxID=2913261 RepID=A0A9X1RMH0_9BURK|nr:hypothetical protein [Paraburkholderia tagetis]MCG5072257.1 hypothetical protein [Paraburkholderia tagetis]